VINPLDKLAFALRIPPLGDALLETIGRHTARPRTTPVCDGTEGDTFWIVAQHGRSADYIRNIEANPRVRVKGSLARIGWRSGTAHILDDDDPAERGADLEPQQSLAPPLPAGVGSDRDQPAERPHRSRSALTRPIPAGESGLSGVTAASAI